ncbi:pilin N-terminal domain-containing protein [uncultured Peptoniphilus sp.]|uniref:pilin N-terminal domain-containing protein n=1 Tax=uncultured Peptoniphilus sp. TaxID=254354 RepID=UPI0025EEFDCE|nr:pilin N-terminal domain-containing protein [uncultured Peptoniphilus sp.]
MNKKKIMSLIMALVMLVGVFSPLTALAEEAANDTTAASDTKDEVTEKVTLHKLVMSKDDLGKWDSDKIKEAGYNATQNTDQLKALLGKGHSAEEVAGVYFAVKDSKGKYVTIKTDTKDNKKPEYGSVDSLDATLPEGYELLAGETKANGIEFNTKGLKGDYTIEEIHEKSSYYNNSKDEKENGKIITDSKAVPVEITLPLYNDKGVVKNAHVYPKNTEEKPEIDKNFAKAKDGEKELEVADGFDAADNGAGIGVGADVKNYQAKKATAEAEIGKKIPYEVKTVIPAKSNLAEAHWDDKMTEGLTYNKDLKVTIGGTEITPSTEGENPELVQTDKGFSLRLQGDNLALLNGKDAEVTVVLTYTATVNSKAIVDIPEANDITFHYGNTPSKGNTPLPVKPKDGQVTVKKTWDNGSKWVEGEYAKFKLVDANTGKDVTADDLVEPTIESEKAAFNTYKESFQGTVTLSKDTTETHTWKYLNNDKQYKVIEVESKTLSDAEYTKAEDGTIEVTNHKSNNPKPLNPTEPKVVTGGKRFVKTNQEGKERLAGAEFYVKKTVDGADKYLVAAKKDAKKVNDAKTALDNAVKAYNEGAATIAKAEDEGFKFTVGETEYTDKDKALEALKAEVDTAQEAYNKAFKENATAYTWGNKDDENVVILTSDGQGRFEITGLEYGEYKLEEKTAPKGFAKLNGDIDFTVAKGSYAGSAEEFKYQVTLEEGETQNYGLQVKNKKVSIPQTGGMGTVLFTIVGISLMAGAVVAMKRNREEA